MEARVNVRVTPRASASRIAGVKDGVLLVRVTAPPVDGRANKAVCDLIAKEAKLPKSAVSVLRGDTGRDKVVALSGVSQTDAEARLGIDVQGELPL